VRLEEALADKLAATVQIRVLRKTRRGEQGEIAISFDTLDELGSLLDRLGVTER
jgi:ParB family chromosome partitioning protein